MHLAVMVASTQGHVIGTEGVPPLRALCAALERLQEWSISGPADYLPAMSSTPASGRRRIALVALLVVVSLVAAACSSSSTSSGDLPDLEDVPGTEASPEDRDMAPDFAVMTLDGAGFTLSEHFETDGRPVFLNMWASWCPPCRAEMPDIDAASESHEDVKFIGVAASDDPADSADFATSIGVGYTIGFDEKGDVARAYEAVGLPASYIISADGVILERIFGSVTEAEIDEILAGLFS